MLGRWIKEVNIKGILHKGQNGELTFPKLKNQIADLIEKEIPNFRVNLRKARTIAEFDRKLDQLYDYADEHRIWLGLELGDKR